MRISIFGLGYVGAVTAGCLSRQGHSIVGVDVSPAKVEMLAGGKAPIIEPGLDPLLIDAHDQKRLTATTDARTAVWETDCSLICVGTPSGLAGSLDLRFVRQVFEEIVLAARERRKRHLILLRSTVLPGTTESLVAEFLHAGDLLEVCSYPEFLREGTAVDDFFHPSLPVVGCRDGKFVSEECLEICGNGASVADWRTAEMVKYASNAFHAAKIVFANEIGRISKTMGVDSRLVMELLCRDRVLNISSYYMRPGNPFGGSCLPKDVRALTYAARNLGLGLPLLENLMESNEQHLRLLLQLIELSGKTDVVILGLSFKENTDDLRESSMVEVAQTLLGKGYRLRIFDPQLNLAELMGSNKRLIDTRMPRLANLLETSLERALGKNAVVVVSQRCASIDELQRVVGSDHHLIDVNGWPELRSLKSRYEGFCW